MIKKLIEAFGQWRLRRPISVTLDAVQLRQYEQWTSRQLDQGAVVSSPRRDHRAFWRAIESKSAPSKVTPIRRSNGR